MSSHGRHLAALAAIRFGWVEAGKKLGPVGLLTIGPGKFLLGWVILRYRSICSSLIQVRLIASFKVLSQNMRMSFASSGLRPLMKVPIRAFWRPPVDSVAQALKVLLIFP